MRTKGLVSLVGGFILIWLFTLLVSFIIIWMVKKAWIPQLWLLLPLVLLIVAVIDSIQKKHSIRRNFPIAGRMRYLFESIRPELRQYFFESDLDGKPFSRRQRSIVYQRSKDEPQTVAFGMQDDPQRVGYEWIAHSNYPKQFSKANLRVLVGGKVCTQPYSASILNIGAMSYGALSKAAIEALNLGAKEAGFAHNTGEGGISPYHEKGGDLIWQVGTGYFGCRDASGHFSLEKYKRNARKTAVKMVEVKLSQGAKPGHGGLLPAAKNTEEIASIRGIEPHKAVHSPVAHSAFTDAVSMLRFIALLREASGGKPVGFKLCLGRKEEFDDICRAMLSEQIFPDFITVDGAEGGTGAAPIEFMDNSGTPLYDALAYIHRTLKEYGLRNELKLFASGKIITAFDMARAMTLGADAFYSARGMMFALGCIQALKCDSGKCPVGIATQERMLYKGLDVQDKYLRVARFHTNTLSAFCDLMGSCGFEKTEDISPKYIYKRIDHQRVLSFDTLYFQDQKHEMPELIQTH